MNIPLLDLKIQYQNLKAELEPVIGEVLASGEYILGKQVLAFEQEIAAYLGVKYAISVGNGTDALVIALKALGIGEGDEVITSPFTFFATAESIAAVGAIPVFADVDEHTFNIQPEESRKKITKRTKAIMPVHIFGQPCKMDEINQLAKEYGLHVIEDACQAIGASYKGKMAGGLGDIACFSFFPTKNLGCAGDGGLITTNDEKLAVICNAIRQHGSGKIGQAAYNLLNNTEETLDETVDSGNALYNPLKYYNFLIGHNSRLDALQAAILRVKLRYLDHWNGKRIINARYYNESLKDTGIKLPVVEDHVKMVYHQYVVASEKRDELAAFLSNKGIGTGIYYPVPLHLQKAFKGMGYKEGDLPVSDYLSKRTVALPVYPELTQVQLDYITACVKEFMNA